MKLVSFKKMDKQRKLIVGSIVGVLLILGSILLYRSYALYKEEKEFNVLKGQIPDFGYDIKMLSVIVDEEEVETIPEKGNYKVDVICNNGKGEWDYINWKLSLSEFERKSRCNIIFKTLNEGEEVELPKSNTIEYRSGTFSGKHGIQSIVFGTPMSGVPQYVSITPISGSIGSDYGIVSVTSTTSVIKDKTTTGFSAYNTDMGWNGTSSVVTDSKMVWSYIAVYDPS